MKAPATLLVMAALSAIVAVAQQPAPTSSVKVPQGLRVVRRVKGDGVQIYTCAKTQDGIKWALPSKPDAKLLDVSGKVVGAHFAGPTWKFDDGGQVQGQNAKELAHKHPGAIAWLLIEAKPGTPTGSLASVTYITRTGTRDGLAPPTGCQSEADLTKTNSVHYTALYTFYAKKK